MISSKILTYGDRELSYVVERVGSVTDKVRIHVDPNNKVRVEAPLDCETHSIQLAVQKRARWIIDQVDDHAAMRAHLSEKEYVSGETHFYLGRRYRLHVTVGDNTRVRLLGSRLTVKVAKGTHAADALNRWYRDKATAYITKRLVAYARILPWLSGPPHFSLKPMEKRWGSCLPDGRLCLHTRLICADSKSVDYVLLHELCHLVEDNHGAGFLSLLDQHMPDWRLRCASLRERSELYLAV